MRRFFRSILTSRPAVHLAASRPTHRLRSIAGLMSLEDRCVPATFTVLNTTDGPVTAAVPLPGSLAGSLRQAIFDANALAGTDDVVFDSSAFSTAKTITLTNGFLTLTDATNVKLGVGSVAPTVDAAKLSDVLFVNLAALAPVSISDLIITNGSLTGGVGAGITSVGADLTLNRVTISNCFSDSGGAGLFVTDGGTFAGSLNANDCKFLNNTMAVVDNFAGAGAALTGALLTASTFTNCTFTGNIAESGLAGKYGFGGGVGITGPTTTISFVGCNFTGNKASANGGDGGAIINNTAILSISGSTFLNNVASTTNGVGGFLRHVPTAALTITNSTITGSTAVLGGGLYLQAAAPVTITGCTWDGNRATTSPGGAIWIGPDAGAPHTVLVDQSTFINNFSGNAGGVLSSNGATGVEVIFRNSTFTQNSVTGRGGVVRTFGTFAGKFTVQNSTMFKNTSSGDGGAFALGGAATASASFVSTIIAGNTGGAAATADLAKTAGTVTVDFSLVGVKAIAPDIVVYTGGNNQEGSKALPLSPLLLPLANYGGNTQTLVPMATSKAINNGSNPVGLTTDQRNNAIVFPRSFNGGVDIGAVEANNPVPIVSAVNAATVTAPAAFYDFTITFTSANSTIDASTLSAAGAVTVSGGAFGSPVAATLKGGPYVTNQTITATFSITPPGGAWDLTDNGTYAINIVANKIKDSVNLSVPAGQVGTFLVGFPQTFTVTTDLDVVDPLDGLTSLREAVTQANNAAGADSIDFAGAPFAGAATIAFGVGLLAMTLSDSVSIVAPVAGVTIDANLTDRIFLISGAKTLEVTLKNLSFKNGVRTTNAFGDNGGAIRIGNANVAVTNCNFENNSALIEGGAVGQNGVGNLTFTNTTFTNNSSTGGNGGALSITNGNATLVGSKFTGNTSVGSGGGISSIGATSLTISNSTFDANSTSGAGFVGGAILISNTSTATISGSTFTGNLSTEAVTGGAGGALAVIGASTVSVDNSGFVGNKVTEGEGGAIWVRGDAVASVTVTRSTFTSNESNGVTTTGGGAIHIGGNQTLTVSGSTFNLNVTTAAGGAIRFENGGKLTLTNSTLSANTAGTNGGGVSFNKLTAASTIQNSTLTLNTATAGIGGGFSVTGNLAGGAVTLSSSIVAKNTAATGNDAAADVALNIAGNNNDVFDVSAPGLITYTGTNPRNGQDPLLGALMNNGGQTETHAITKASPAYNFGNNAAALANDQRGATFARVGGASADIGAFEFQEALPPTATIVVDDGTAQRSMVRTFTVTFSEPVNLAAGAFTLQRLNTSTIPAPAGFVTLVVTPAGPGTVFTISFNDPTFATQVVNSKSLIDGKYTLTLVASQITSVGSGLTPSGNVALNTTRIFGDANGDGDTDNGDFTQFRLAIGAGPNSTFDVDGDGDVDNADFAGNAGLGYTGFRQRFGQFA